MCNETISMTEEKTEYKQEKTDANGKYYNPDFFDLIAWIHVDPFHEPDPPKGMVRCKKCTKTYLRKSVYGDLCPDDCFDVLILRKETPSDRTEEDYRHQPNRGRCPGCRGFFNLSDAKGKRKVCEKCVSVALLEEKLKKNQDSLKKLVSKRHKRGRKKATKVPKAKSLPKEVKMESPDDGQDCFSDPVLDRVVEDMDKEPESEEEQERVVTAIAHEEETPEEDAHSNLSEFTRSLIEKREDIDLEDSEKWVEYTFMKMDSILDMFNELRGEVEALHDDVMKTDKAIRFVEKMCKDIAPLKDASAILVQLAQDQKTSLSTIDDKFTMFSKTVTRGLADIQKTPQGAVNEDGRIGTFSIDLNLKTGT